MLELRLGVETIRQTSAVVVRKSLNSMARPEGFEPPTPRSVVRFNPYTQAPAQRRRSNFQGNLNLFSVLVLAVSQYYGNTVGNKQRKASAGIARITLRYLICGPVKT